MISNLNSVVYKLDKFTKRYNNTVNLKQNDVRTFNVAFYENGEELNITDFSVEVRWVKPDNKFVDLTGLAITKNRNTASFKLNPQCTKVPGLCKFEIALSKDGFIDTTWTINIMVEQSVISNAGASANVSNLLDKLTQANTTANATYTKVDNWAKSHANVDTLITDVDSIKSWQIGGRNLLKNTKDFIGVEGNSNIIDEKYNGCSIRYFKNNNSSSPSQDIAQWNDVLYPELGGVYTLSFWAKGTGSMHTYFNGDTNCLQVKSYISSGGSKSSASNGDCQFNLTSNWKRYWVTYTLEDTGNTDVYKYVLFRHCNNSTSEEICICGAKLERGHKATDWSPDPEDVEEKFTKLDERLVNKKEMHGMIAHRGLCDIYPENTLFAFQQCINNHKELFGVETDVWQSKDGEFFIMHDETVDRTTNGTGAINNLTSNYIKSLKIDTGTNLNGMDLKVPTLDKVLQLFQNSNLYICLELKPQSSFNYDKFCNMIQAYGMENKVIIISFDINMLLQVRKRLPYIYIMGNLDLTQSNIDTYGYLYNFIYSFPVNQFNQGLVNQVLNHKQVPLPWLINDCGTLMNMKKGRCKLFTSNCIDRM